MSVNLNRRLVLEEPLRVADGAGGYTETWFAKGTLWASIRPGTGRERFSAETSVTSVPLRIVVRGAPYGAASRPRPDQRFREGERVYVILGVSEYDADARYLTCVSVEEAAA